MRLREIGEPDYNPNGWAFDRNLHAGDPAGLFQSPSSFMPVYQASVPVSPDTSSDVAIVSASAVVPVGAGSANGTGEVPIPAVSLVGTIPGWLQWVLIAVAIYFLWKWTKGLK